MVVICDANDIIEYGRRISEPSKAPLHMNQDTTSMEKFKVLRS